MSHRAERSDAVRARRKQLAVIGDIIKHAGRFRRSAGDERKQSGERIRRRRARRVGVDDAVLGQSGERALRMVCDVILQVDGVEAIDTDQQDMPDLIRRILVCRCG